MEFDLDIMVERVMKFIASIHFYDAYLWNPICSYYSALKDFFFQYRSAEMLRRKKNS